MKASAPQQNAWRITSLANKDSVTKRKHCKSTQQQNGNSVPTISIVLPVYNMEQYIRETIDSILNQSFSDFELLCIDDGSTDKTHQLLEGYAARDNRIKLIRQKNLGPGAARNKGLELASGAYVIMLDADDLYHPSMIEKMYEKAISVDADIVVTRSTQFEDKTNRNLESWWTVNISQIPNKEVFSPLEMRDYIFSAFLGWPWDKLYKRSFIEENEIRYPALSNSEDLYFVFLSLARAQRISVIEESLIRHRVGRQGSVSNSRANEPLAFYTSSCLLKQQLRKDSELYEAYSWGFLNWAFGYMLWNIETMTNERARTIQLRALANDEFPELEIGLHSSAFFSLEPNYYERYCALLEEATGCNRRSSTKRGGRLLSRLIQFLCILQDNGLAYSMQRSLNWLARKVLHLNSDETASPKLKRGEDLPMTPSRFIASQTKNPS